MKKIVTKVEQFFVRWENNAVGWELLAVGFCALIVARILVENLLNLYDQETALYIFYEFTHVGLSFALTYVIAVFLFAKIFKRPLIGVATIFLVALLIILTPPILDRIIGALFFGGQLFISYYEFDSLSGLWQRFLTFFGDDPTNGTTYGVRIEVGLALAFVALYGYSVSRHVVRTIGGVLAMYTFLFIMGTFPSWLTILLRGPEKGFFAITNSDIAALFLSPTQIFVENISTLQNALNVKMSFMYFVILCVCAVTYFLYARRGDMITFFLAMRPVQMTYHAGLLLFGLALGLFFTTEVILMTIFTVTATCILIVAAVSAWISAALVNDLCDEDIDKISNAHRPLIKGTFSRATYKKLAVVFFLLSLFAALLVHIKLALLVFAYHALTWLYNMPPFRLKRVPLIATALAVASLLILALGFVVTVPAYTLETFPWTIGALLFVAYTLILPVKDLKDIAGDKKAGIKTLPVLFGEKTTRLVVAGATFCAYVISPVIFGVPEAMLWAILFGALSFWSTIRMRLFGKKITPRQLPGVIFGVVAAYSLFLLVLFF